MERVLIALFLSLKNSLPYELKRAVIITLRFFYLRLPYVFKAKFSLLRRRALVVKSRVKNKLKGTILLRRRVRFKKKAVQLRKLAIEKNKKASLTRLSEREKNKAALLRARERSKIKAVKLRKLAIEKNKKMALVRLREREVNKAALLKAREKKNNLRMTFSRLHALTQDLFFVFARKARNYKVVQLRKLAIEKNKKVAIARLREREKNKAALLRARERSKIKAIQLRKRAIVKNKKVALARLREREVNKAALLKAREKKNNLRMTFSRLHALTQDLFFVFARKARNYKVVQLRKLAIEKNKKVAIARLREREKNKAALLRARERSKIKAIQLRKRAIVKNKKVALARLREREVNKATLKENNLRITFSRLYALTQNLFFVFVRKARNYKAVQLRKLAIEKNKKVAIARLREREKNKAALLRTRERSKIKAVQLRKLAIGKNKEVALVRLGKREVNKANLLRSREIELSKPTAFSKLCAPVQDLLFSFRSKAPKYFNQALYLFRLVKSSNVAIVRSDFEGVSYGQPRLLFVENSALADDFLVVQEFLSAGLSYVVFRGKADYLRFLEFGGDHLHDIHMVSYIPTIDQKLDEKIYGAANCYAEEIINNIRDKFKGSVVFDEFSSRLSFSVNALSDRLVGLIRSAQYLEDFCIRNKVKVFCIAGNRSIATNLISFWLGDVLGVSSYIFNAHGLFSSGRIIFADCINGSWPRLGKSKITRYFINDSISDDDDLVFFFCNLKDPMYRESLSLVMSELQKRLSCRFVMLPPYADDRDLRDARYTYVAPEPAVDDLPGFSEFNAALDSAFNLFIQKGFAHDHAEGLLRTYVVMNAKNSIHRVIRDCFALMHEMDEVASRAKIKALIANPGRPWVAEFLLGSFSDIPSFDIQSGTLSKSLRFKKPVSRYLLAVDDFSRRVYSDWLRFDESNIEVVGAPRIDSKLSMLRGVSKEESRLSIPFQELRAGKILCVATQPCSIEIMSDMLKVVEAFVRISGDWSVLLSMHPGENEAFEIPYRKIFSELIGERRAYVTRENIYHNINAADAVITYYSTSGIEAFCLGRPVFSYRSPNGERVPFDLCDIGVARPFSSVNELEWCLTQALDEDGCSPGLLRLKDGRSVERICSFILDRI